MDATVVLPDSERYKRQLMLNGFSETHQARLRNATAVVAGVGGLGGTAAVYLAAAGVGRLRLVHAGDLTLSNMNRQILMREDWIGQSRVVMAMKRLLEINSSVRVEIFDKRFTDGNAQRLIKDADIALSARPNFQERRSLNAACVETGMPMVEAAMNGMEGYLFNVIPGRTACLECVYPEDNPWWKELGFPVLGAVSGTLGCLMATEAIKILTGFGKPLISEMLLFNMFDTDFRKVSSRRDVNCPVCGSASARIGIEGELHVQSNI